jgi:hypothetical protein
MSKRQSVKYPYGRPSAIQEIFKLIQEEKEWKPSAINTSTLKTLGIAPSKESLAVNTLKFLGVLDEVERPTTVFQDLRSNFQSTLEKQVRVSYQPIFDQIPLSRINQASLVNFFMNEGYNEDTAEYQGSLYVFLCKTANIELPNASTSFKRARFKKQNTKVEM